MLKKLLKFVLYLLGLALLGVVSWGAALYFEWPWWGGLAFFLAVIGLMLGVAFVRRLIYIARARNRIAQSAAEAQRIAAPAFDAPRDLRQRWNEAIATLRRSSLKRLGNPLYVLPWYLVLGHPGAGKTTALARSRLSSPIKEVSPLARVEATRTCDWWYFDQAVVIDTTGRYAAPQSEQQDRQEWEQLLVLLDRCRRKEPLNGLVIAVAADRLFAAQPDALADEGRFLRRRINEVMHLLDTRFPVYVLVTKCDVLFGMEQWSRLLPESSLEQAMGYLGGAEPAGYEVKAFLDLALASVTDRLKDLRLLLARKVEKLDPGLLLFPDELERLRGGLEVFLGGAFGSDPYLEAPYLRGLFFASGEQAGEATSRVVQDPALAGRVATLAGTSRGIFLRDFFGQVLPRDRRAFRPLGAMVQWKRVTRNVGMTSWLLLSVAAAVFLTISFTKSFYTLEQIRSLYPASIALTGKLQDDLANLNKLSELIRWMEDRDDDWETDLVAFNNVVIDLEDKLKRSFSQRFRDYVLAEMDREIERKLRELVQQDPDNDLPAYIQMIVRRINLGRARQQGRGYDDLRKMPLPSVEVLFKSDPVAAAELARQFNRLYLAYMAWRPDDLREPLKLDTMKEWLNKVALESQNLNWLATWANNQPDLRAATLTEFWPGSRRVVGAVTVPPAFTAAGRRAMESFLREVEATSPGASLMAERRAAFEAWYLQERLRAWHHFAWNFEQGRDALAGELEWKAVMGRIASEQNPYYALIRRLLAEFEGYRDDKLPDWVRLAREFDAVRAVAMKESLVPQASRIGGIVGSVGGQLIRDAIKGELGRGKALFQDRLNAAKAFKEYNAALEGVWKDAVASRAKAFKVSADFHAFALDPAVKESPLHNASSALETVKKLLGRAADIEAQAIWSLVAGPLDFVIAYVDQETSCNLQKEWEANVVWPTQSAASTADVTEMLYGKQGSVLAFAEGVAKPFLQRGARQYQAVETLGHRIPFTGRFLPFLNEVQTVKLDEKLGQEQAKASREKAELDQQQQALEIKAKLQGTDKVLNDTRAAIADLKKAALPITITGLPTGVTPGAKAVPYATVLTVQCASGPRALTNYNFPVSDTFSWSPEACGDTALEIKVETLTLAKKYPGPRGFGRFLREFYDGEHSFRAGDFPSQRTQLEELGIRNISVRYEFSGLDAVLRQMDQLAQLERREKEKLAEKQKLQETQDKLESRKLDQKRAELKQQPAAERNERPAVKAALPEKIAACWDSSGVAAARAPQKPQTLLQRAEDEVKMVGQELFGSKEAAPKPAPVPAAPLKPERAQPAPFEGYMVQLGLFGPENAARLKSALRSQGIEPRQYEVTREERVYYKIRIGPYPSEADAAEVAREMDAKFRIQSLIVRPTKSVSAAN